MQVIIDIHSKHIDTSVVTMDWKQKGSKYY